MTISSKVQRFMEQGSWIRRMFEEGAALRKQYGADRVFDLSLGNPILEPPPRFQEELRKLAECPVPGLHRYMPNAGLPETRGAVADQLRKETGLPFTMDQVVMTCGAGGAMNVALKAVLDPGDEVILLAPYFPEYPFYVDNHGGVTRVVPTGPDFQPDAASIEEAITPRTRALIINSPNNPAGVVYTSEALRAAGEVLRRAEQRHHRQVYLISDEPYAKLIYDGLHYPQVLQSHPSTIVATSYSKDLSLPGERIGYLAVGPECPGKEELVNALVFCNRVLGFVNAPALMQYLVRFLQGVTVDIEWYRGRRDLMYNALTGMGYQMVKPQGAFYLFPRTPVEDDVAFVRQLQQHLVLAVPGSGFGSPGHMRISYCLEQRVLEGSLEGFRKAARAAGLRG